MAQIVYDNDYLVDAMTEKGWPLRWQTWPVAATALSLEERRRRALVRYRSLGG